MLIARNFDRSTGLHWQGGVFLKDRYHDAEGLVELADGGRSLQLALRGAEADWLFGLRDGVERVLNGWRDLRADLMVPCPRCDRGRFDYQQLLVRRKRGKTDASCSGRGACGEDVSIAELLYGFPAPTLSTALMSSQVLHELAEIRTDLKGIRTSQDELIAVGADIQRVAAETKEKLRQVLKDIEREGLDGPRLFTLLPPGERRWRSAVRKTDLRRDVFELTLWCEYPSGYHPLEGARYLVQIPREWWVRAAPLVRITAQALRMIVPVLLKLPEVLSPGRANGVVMRRRHTESSGNQRSGPRPLADAGDADTRVVHREARLKDRRIHERRALPLLSGGPGDPDRGLRSVGQR